MNDASLVGHQLYRPVSDGIYKGTNADAETPYCNFPVRLMPFSLVFCTKKSIKSYMQKIALLAVPGDDAYACSACRMHWLMMAALVFTGGGDLIISVSGRFSRMLKNE